MKRIIIITLAMAFSLSAFAGILENRGTGETIEFIMNRADMEVEILSTAKNVGNTVIRLEEVGEKKSQIRFFKGTIYTVKNAPPFVIFPLAYELTMLVFKAPIKLFQNMTYKRDFKKLMKAITSTDTIRVGERRFRRIEKLIQHQ